MATTANSAAAASVAIPTHAVGNQIVIWAYRDGNATIPTKPAAAGTVPAWNDADAGAGANTNSGRTASFIATATNHTTGTWTNATGIVAAVVSGQSGGIGGHATAGTTGTNTASAPAITQVNTTGASTILEFYGHRTVTAWGTAPAGYTRVTSVATEVCLNTKDSTTTDGAIAQPCTAAVSGYRGATVEVLPQAAKSATLTDNCSTVDTTRWQEIGGTASVVAGALRLTYDTSAATFCYYESLAHYDFTASSFTAEIPDPGPLQSGWSAGFLIGPGIIGGDNYLRFNVSTLDGVAASVVNAGVPDYDQATGGGTWSATTHRWLRVRVASPTIFFETAPDGTTWTTRFSTPLTTAAWSLTAAQALLVAERVDANASNGYTAFDNINLAPTVAAGGGNFFSFFTPGRATLGGVPAGGLPDIQPASYWTAQLDAQEDFEWTYVQDLMTNFDDSWNHYSAAYSLDTYVAMFEATDNVFYLDKAISIVNAAISGAAPSTTLGSNAFGDSYTGWVSFLNGSTGEEEGLYETYFWRYAARLLSAIKNNSTTATSRLSQFNTILAFMEVNIWDKWYNRGTGQDWLYREATNMAGHCAYIALHLGRHTANSTRITRCNTVRTNIESAGMSLYGGDSLRAKITASLGHSTPGGYTWDWAWQSLGVETQDVGHAGGETGFIAESMDYVTPAVWTLTDMNRFEKTLRDLVWPTDADFLDGVLGDAVGWMPDGWPKLGRHSVTMQQGFEDYAVSSVSQATGSQGQFMAAMAANARKWGVL